MNTWILILFLLDGWHVRVATTHITFRSQESCEKALAKIVQVGNEGYCVEDKK